MGLITRDALLYGEVASYLRERRIPTLSLLPGQRIPARVAVVVTSRAEVKEIDFPRVLVAAPGDVSALSAALRKALQSDQAPRWIWVGVDSGPRPGYAVVESSGALLEEGVVDTPEEIAPLARRLRRHFPRARLTFRVGMGDPVRRSRIVNSLLHADMEVERTPEERTTPQGRRQNDPMAARAIAAIPGEVVEELEEVRIPPGEISNLQRISREMSGGLFTLPRESAMAVLEGSLPMSEALRLTAARLGLPWPEGHPETAKPRRPPRA